MVKLALKIRLEAENVTAIKPADDFEFTFKIQCTSCREVHPNAVSVNIHEEREISGSRGSANLVWRCQNCKKEHSASFIAPASSSKDLIAAIDPSDTSAQALIALDCRGLEPVSFEFSSGRGGSWHAKAETEESGGKSADFDFDLDEDGRWDDWDEKNGREVSVREIEAKWERM